MHSARVPVTYHESLDRIIDHFDGYSTTVEHCAVVVSAVMEEPRDFMGYFVVDVPNRAKRRRSMFAVHRRDVVESVGALFPGGVPPRGIVAGPVAIVHTHPARSSTYPSTDDRNGVPQYILGVVVTPTENTTRWYTRERIIKRPQAVAPHSSWTLPLSYRSMTTSASVCA